jgi:predicted KAP-like P-loop ATPase
VRPILTALANVGDELIAAEPSRQVMFDMGIDVHISRLYWQLLRRLPSDQRFGLLMDVFKNGQSLQLLVHETAVFGQEQGKFGGQLRTPEDMWLLTPDQLNLLEVAMLERFRSAAYSDELFGYRALPQLLHCWSTWANSDEPRNWVQKQIATDANLVAFVEKHLGETISETVEAAPQSWKTTRLDPNGLRPYLNLEETMKRIRVIAALSAMTDRQRIAVNQLIKEYDQQDQHIDQADGTEG